jgi:2,3,4,5-tetrahydropyridine-2,6-dicarboxylate N-succinyltransferase
MKMITFDALREKIETMYEMPEQAGEEEFNILFSSFKDGLNSGKIRSAEKKSGKWEVNTWVKKGILLGFRFGILTDMSVNDKFVYYDKSTYPLKNIGLNSGVRIVPGGSSIRDGCYIGKNVTCMPPMYINVGAYVDEGTMIDSHALVGSCAQIGKRVHLSAAAQIGGVLEPVGSMPVVIEDDVLVGGGCGVYEGAIVKRGAVLGAGTVLTASTPVYDLVHQTIIRGTPEQPLTLPEDAVVIPGCRAVKKGKAEEWGLSIYTPVIVKYKDAKSNSGIALEDWLR